MPSGTFGLRSSASARTGWSTSRRCYSYGGDNLPPVPRKHRRPFKKGAVKRTILAMLREGPTTTEAVAMRLMELGDIRWRTARATAHGGLHTLKRQGVVEGGASEWRLT